jgi:hypothetical protein
LAELEGDTQRALQSYLDVMRLGSASVRGGLADHLWQEHSLLRFGGGAIASLRGQLSPDQCRQAIEVAQSIEANLEPAGEVLARHAVWTECVRGGHWRIGQWLDGRLRRWVEQTAVWNQVRMRLLICELAVEQYRLERGSEPAALIELVPGYLPSVPMDPCSAGPLRYRQAPSGPLVYSVGPDGVDNGGEPMQRWEIAVAIPGDVLLREPKYLYLGEW